MEKGGLLKKIRAGYLGELAYNQRALWCDSQGKHPSNKLSFWGYFGLALEMYSNIYWEKILFAVLFSFLT